MNSTKLLYLEDFNLLTVDAAVVDVLNEEGRDVVVLDQTIFYPQSQTRRRKHPRGLRNSLDLIFSKR